MPVRGAVGVRDPKLLNKEHVVPRRVLIDRMLTESARCAEIMGTAIACLVLKEKNRRLTDQDRATSGLDGWERYRAAGVEVVDLAEAPCAAEAQPTTSRKRSTRAA